MQLKILCKKLKKMKKDKFGYIVIFMAIQRKTIHFFMAVILLQMVVF